MCNVHSPPLRGGVDAPSEAKAQTGWSDRRNVLAELTTPARQPAGCRATPPLRGGEYAPFEQTLLHAASVHVCLFSSGGAMGTTFRDQLVTTRDRKHSKDHPFFQLWVQGKLTKKQTTIYCAQHYHYVTEYLNWMAYEASQIPLRDVKTYLFENLGDEENPDDRHLDMLKDYVAATGSSRDSVEDSVVLAGTECLQNWGWRLVYQTPWQAALAGMFIGLESQFLDICKKIVPALHQH